MAIVKPFLGILPKQELAEKVACLPYDVMNRSEAKTMAANNPYSFLHVVRSEIDLDDSVGDYDERVYAGARKALDHMLASAIMTQDDSANFYIYRQMMNGRVQTGIVACTSIDDYLNNVIKKHEFTRPSKEVDRIRNFDACDAHTEPVFLTYRQNPELSGIIREWIKYHMPHFDFVSEDGIAHVLWRIENSETTAQIERIFQAIPYLYIADGHHRSASSVKVGLSRREARPNYTGEEPFNYFMAVIFPDEDLFIMDYNRVVTDLNGYDKQGFMKAVLSHFEMVAHTGGGAYKPGEHHEFGMYLDGMWYGLKAKTGTYDEQHPIERLDVSILQKNLLGPILGIEDPRTDERIDFIGGIRGLDELEKRVNNGAAVAFALFPPTMEDLMSVADAGQVMPPKSTWFEPKLRSGLFVHRLF